MVIKKTLRLGSTDSAFSVNRDFDIGVNIEGTKKMLPYNDLSRAVDAYEVYENEREKSDRFRLTLTINPFCTNVLYNACTEIVLNEGKIGDDYQKPVLDSSGNTISVSSGDVYGKFNNLSRVDMIENTEYSKQSLGFSYHPGVDIFDNHMFRSNSFRVLCKGDSGERSNVNTIRDKMRYYDGTTIISYHRDGSPTPLNPSRSELYMYGYDNTMSFAESVSSNLREDDGWFGFYNICRVKSDYRNDGQHNSVVMPNKVIEVGNGCDFVDMYPDRTLFSFTPKYNKYQKRKEDNWSVILTYPYNNFDNHPLVRNVVGYDNDSGMFEYGNLNALLLMSVEVYNNGSGDRRVMFRTYTKHGLKPGDIVNMYYSYSNVYKALVNHVDFEPSEDYPVYQSPILVTATGDYNGDNEDCYFSANAFDAIRYILTNQNIVNVNPDAITDSEVNAYLSQFNDSGIMITFRFRKVVSDIESLYCFRVMRRLPNFKYASSVLDKKTASNKEAFERYYAENAIDSDGNFVEYDKESYKLAFANTIYNDNITQYVVMDDVVIGNLVDNWGRPLSEIFYTVVKRNDGYADWYKNNPNVNNSNVTFSHCFGKLTSGIWFLPSNSDAFQDMWSHKAMLSDCHCINNMNLNNTVSMETYIGFNNEISWDDNLFVGDLVCYNDMESEEVVIGDLCHRFNTAQRELANEAISSYRFTTHEIMSNDFDVSRNIVSYPKENQDVDDEIIQPEGYYYKAHYSVKTGQFGSVNQSSHQSVNVSSATPVQEGGVCIKVVSGMKHNLYGGNELYICNDSVVPKIWYTSRVRSVIDDYTVLIDPIGRDETPYFDWITTSEYLANGTFRLRRKNYDIPDYAKNVRTNTFIWRDRLGNGNIDNNVVNSYPFSNGCFYIDTVIDFYLRRQDPFGINGLMGSSHSMYYMGIYGDERKKSNASFVGEKKTVC